MKKKLIALVLCSLGALSVFALAGCGASLDRDVSVHSMTMSVPSNWAEDPSESNSDANGNIWYTDIDKNKDDEKCNAIYVAYQSVDPSDKSRAKDALGQKQQELESDYGVVNWDIDDSDEQVIDGAEVTTYEYSFDKIIDHTTRTYEYKVIYAYTPTIHYEIQIYGDAVSIKDVVKSLEF